MFGLIRVILTIVEAISTQRQRWISTFVIACYQYFDVHPSNRLPLHNENLSGNVCGSLLKLSRNFVFWKRLKINFKTGISAILWLSVCPSNILSERNNSSAARAFPWNVLFEDKPKNSANTKICQKLEVLYMKTYVQLW